MLGAIIGDIVGSRFERHNIKTKEFELLTHRCHPTDDSVMSLAVAEAILDYRDGVRRDLRRAFADCMQKYGRRYPDAGYGGSFSKWLEEDDPQPYNSWGNGSAMRVSPCGFAAGSLEEALELARVSAVVTHNHPEAIKGARAVAAAIRLALEGKSMPEIRDHITENYYRIHFTLDEIRASYRFDVSCQGSVPQALEAFFESTGFEDAIRNAVSIGGDSDTIAAITGGIAEAYYGIPEELRRQALPYLYEDELQVLNRFEERYGIHTEKNGSKMPEKSNGQEIAGEPANYWIIPCNIRKYNVIGAFRNLKKVDWKQSFNAKVNDTVFIYASAPISAVVYQCRVNKVDLDKVEIDDSPYVIDGTPYANYSRHMEIELLRAFDMNIFWLEELRKYGVRGNIQGPMRVPESLLRYMKEQGVLSL